MNIDATQYGLGATEQMDVVRSLDIEIYARIMAAVATAPKDRKTTSAAEKFAARIKELSGSTTMACEYFPDPPSAIAAAEKIEPGSGYVDYWNIGSAAWACSAVAAKILDTGEGDGAFDADTADGRLMVDLLCEGWWFTIQYSDRVLFVAAPDVCTTDAEGRLHCVNRQPALRWSGEGARAESYFWHGLATKRRVVQTPELVTASEYVAMDTEQRRILSEVGGNDLVVKLFDLSLVNSASAQGLTYELYKSSVVEAGGSRPEQWLRVQSPLLKDGSQPWYWMAVHEDLKTALGARRYIADPPTEPAECDKHPEMEFGIEA